MRMDKTSVYLGTQVYDCDLYTYLIKHFGPKFVTKTVACSARSEHLGPGNSDGDVKMGTVQDIPRSPKGFEICSCAASSHYIFKHCTLSYSLYCAYTISHTVLHNMLHTCSSSN